MRRSAWGLLAAACIAAGPVAAATRPQLSVTPLTADCGTLPAGQDAACETFAVANLGFSALHVTSAGLTGADSGDFGVEADSCTGATVGMGASCAVAVRFTPKTVGAKAAALLIASDDPDTPLWSAALAGEAVEPPAADGGAAAPHALGVLLVAALTRRRRVPIARSGVTQ